MDAFDQLLGRVRACALCAGQLPEGPRPVVRGSPAARLLIIGQAPGRRVHASGIPWDDPSGRRLREWMGVDAETFYDESRIAIMPMGFCYPGTGRSGDLPPRPECAAEWHGKIRRQLRQVELTLLLSRYAIAHYLPAQRNQSVAETVRGWRDHLPDYLPLPHPSPRNNRWLSDRPWFEAEVIPYLQSRIRAILDHP